MAKRQQKQQKNNEYPKPRPFKTRGSSEFISFVAWLCYIAAGISAIIIIAGLINGKESDLTTRAWYVLIGGLFSGSVLMVLYNISEDLHFNSYCTELLLNDYEENNQLLIQHLTDLEKRLILPEQQPSGQSLGSVPPETDSRVRIIGEKKNNMS